MAPDLLFYQYEYPGRCYGSADQELAGTMRGSCKSHPYAAFAREKGEEENGSGAWDDG